MSKSVPKLNDKIKRLILQNGLYNFMKDPDTKGFPISATSVLIFFAFPAAGYFLLYDIVADFGFNPIIAPIGGAVLGLVFLIIMAVGLLRPKKESPERTKIVEELFTRLERRYGNDYGDVHKIFKTIETEMEHGQVYSVGDGSLGLLTDNWYLNFEKIPTAIKIADIAAIIGFAGIGTFIIPDEGPVVETTFGYDHWGKVFSLFAAKNPFVMSYDDRVYTNDKQEITVAEAFQKGDIQAVVNEFNRKKAAIPEFLG